MDWNDTLKEVKDFIKNNDVAWFRGQSKCRYKLKASLFRERFDTLDQYIKQEQMYYNYFKNMGYLYHNEIDWKLLFLMRHHGVHTRLLDWTESFAVALFFAYHTWNKEDDMCIWMLNPLELNKKSLDNKMFFSIEEDNYCKRLYKRDAMDFLPNSIAIHPIRNSVCLVAQQGVFTVQGNLLKPLDEEFDGQLIKDNSLKCIRISPDMEKEADMFLRMSGINAFTLFPDLEGLARYLNDRYSN